MSSYTIVYSHVCCSDIFDNNEHIKDLEEKVNKMLAEGWSCIGGVVLCAFQGEVMRMYQTMVKLPV